MDLKSVGAFLCFGKCITGILPVDLLELHLYLIITTVWKTVLQKNVFRAYSPVDLKCITGILPVDLLELHLYLKITTVWKIVLQRRPCYM